MPLTQKIVRVLVHHTKADQGVPSFMAIVGDRGNENFSITARNLGSE
jgi:hypothetical protein